MKLVWLPAWRVQERGAVGALVRWRDTGRGRWQYAYCLAFDASGIGTYSATPGGSAFMSKAHPFGEVATVVTA